MRPVLREAVFGTADAGAVAAMVDRLCRDRLGAGVADGLFVFESAGSVMGVRLDDGRRVVVKAYQRRWTSTFLAAVVAVQRSLAAGGFPCAMPLTDPSPIGAGFATVDTFLDDPGPVVPEPSDLAVSAAALAEVVDRVAGAEADVLRVHPLQGAGSLYPEPHSPLFDFVATAAGAEWIDALARTARAARDEPAGVEVVAHTDWSARNLRFAGGHLVAAYDWDSLATVPEPVAVGQAAATWRSLGELDDPPAPGAAEVAAYVDAYGVARGRPFTPAERRQTGAAALWCLTYTARCEHALDRHGLVNERARNTLRAEGDAYLAI